MVENVAYRYFGAFRLILALLVVFNHGWFLDRYSLLPAWSVSIHIGSASVLGFFVLSGAILFEASDRWYAERPVAFIANRVLKIIPAYLAALMLSFVVHCILLFIGRLEYGIAFEGYSAVPATLFEINNLGMNLMAVIPDFLYFDAFRTSEMPYLFVRYIWAVRVEVTFYLVLAMMIGWRPRLGQLWIVICAVIAGVLYSYAAWRGTLDASLMSTPTLLYTPTFLLGIAIYGRRKGWGYLVLMLINLLLSAVPAAEITTGVNILRDPASISFHGMVGICAFYAIVLAVIVLQQAQRFVLSKKWDSRLGDLSYALYLNHYIVLVIFAATFPDGVGHQYFWGAVCSALVLSIVMHRIVERPLRSWRDKVRRHEI